MCFFLVLTGKGNILITNCMVSLNEDIYFRKFHWPILGTVSVMAWGWLDLSESPDSPWARTPKMAIWYQKEGQILTYIFENVVFSSLFWCMITMPNE